MVVDAPATVKPRPRRRWQRPLRAAANGVVLVTRTGDTTAPLTVFYKAKGSAKAGMDYKPLPGQVTIPAGSPKAKIKIKAINGSPNAGCAQAAS